MQSQVSDLKDELVALEKEFSDYDDISADLEHMKDKLDNLRCYIDDYEDGSEFMKGMKYACGMVERWLYLRWLINYIRSYFYKHEWELLGHNDVYDADYDKRPIYHQWIYRCKKCGCKKRYKKQLNHASMGEWIRKDKNKCVYLSFQKNIMK